MMNKAILSENTLDKESLKKSHKKSSWFLVALPYLMVLPAFCVVILFIAYPISTTIIRSFQNATTKAFTLEHYAFFLTDKIQQANFIYTFKIVIATVVLSLIFGYLMALFIRFSDSRISRLVSLLNLMPRFIPGLVAVYSMMMVIRDSGVINRVSKLFGYDFKPGLMFNEYGITLMNLWFNIPFVTLLILASLSSVKNASVEAAKDVRASKLLILTKIILPVTYKDILVAMTFVFMGNVGSFTTPFLMGGNHPKMLGIALYDQFNNYLDYEKTAALSVLMFLICSVSATVYIISNMKKEKWQA